MSLSGNTAKINELIAKINALPEAGSGGGSGGGVETCTVQLNDGGNTGAVIVQTYQNGVYSSEIILPSEHYAIDQTRTNVVKNSIVVYVATGDRLEFSIEGGAEVLAHDIDPYVGIDLYSVLITGDAYILT